MRLIIMTAKTCWGNTLGKGCFKYSELFRKNSEASISTFAAIILVTEDKEFKHFLLASGKARLRNARNLSLRCEGSICLLEDRQDTCLPRVYKLLRKRQGDHGNSINK